MTARARFRRGEPVDDIGHQVAFVVDDHRPMPRRSPAADQVPPVRLPSGQFDRNLDAGPCFVLVGKGLFVLDGHADGHSTDAVTCGNSYTNGVWARQECFWRRPSPCAQDPQSSGPRWSGLDRTYRQSPHPGAPRRRACNSPTQPSASGRLVAFWSQELENLHDVMSN